MKPPFKSSYWVVKNKLLVGEIPTASDIKATSKKLKALIKVKVGAVINLMEANEKDHMGDNFYDYSDFLKQNNIHTHRYPIRDMDIPSPIQMMRILKQIEFYNKQGRIVYIHCWGGLGRTETVIGCYLQKNKLADKSNVLALIKELKKDSAFAEKDSPQTEE